MKKILISLLMTMASLAHAATGDISIMQRTSDTPGYTSRIIPLPAGGVTGVLYLNALNQPAWATLAPSLTVTSGVLSATGSGGSVGPAGPAGASAYQVAVAQGYSGNVAAWLASLQGAPGASGPASTVPGPQGPAGPAGADSTVPGPQGPQGPAGAASTIPGPQGPAGAASTVPGPQGPQGIKGDTGATGAASTVPGPQGPSGATGPAGTTTWAGITDKPATYAPAAHTQAFSTITATPTTLAGYGITDAATTAQIATKYNTPTGTTAQYVRGDGSLATLPITVPRVFSYSNRAVATCFQLSATRDVQVAYVVDVTTTLTLTNPARGSAYLRTYTDSACTAGQQTLVGGTGGLPAVLSVTVGLQNIGSVALPAIVPAGAWVRIETVSDVAGGNVVFAIRTPAQEVAL